MQSLPLSFFCSIVWSKRESPRSETTCHSTEGHRYGVSDHRERRIAALLSLSAQKRWRPFTHLHCVLAHTCPGVRCQGVSFRVTLALLSSKLDTPLRHTVILISIRDRFAS